MLGGKVLNHNSCQKEEKGPYPYGPGGGESAVDNVGYLTNSYFASNVRLWDCNLVDATKKIQLLTTTNDPFVWTA